MAVLLLRVQMCYSIYFGRNSGLQEFFKLSLNRIKENQNLINKNIGRAATDPKQSQSLKQVTSQSCYNVARNFA